MNQFGKFQRISSWVDPENLLLNVGDDFEMATLLSRQYLSVPKFPGLGIEGEL